MSAKPILLFVVNEAYFFVSHRLPIALQAMDQGYDVHIAAPSDNIWAPAGFSVAALSKQGFTYHEIPLSRRGTRPWQEMCTFFTLLRLYKRLQPDIIHHLTIKPNLYGGLAARLAGVPSVVYAITGLGQMFVGTRGTLRLIKPIVLWFLRVAMSHRNSRVIVQNISDRNFLVSNKIVSFDKAVLIRGSGVDLALFRPTPELDGDPIVILPARLIWEKGVHEFVESARLLRGKDLAVRFVLVGSTHPSNPRAVPERTLLGWVDEGVIEWWGRREDMPQVMAESHIVCQPSKYGEGVPKVLLEAAAAGRPVVATDTPGCREVVLNEVTGLLASVADVGSLADALQRLIESPGLRVAIGQAARKRAETEFAIDTVVESTLLIYSDLRAATELNRF